jgi:NADPH:quinone reductase-like Zn-dependent oxidoreductase
MIQIKSLNFRCPKIKYAIRRTTMKKMKAAVFVEPGRIVLEDKSVPDIGPLDALIKITTTTICGTDIHILKGEYPVERGLTIGHEPVGVIEKSRTRLLRGAARDRWRYHSERI